MKKLNIEELKEIQLQILSVVAEFCEKNQIKYWIDSGTLLGAVRHGGYIPWDDDIDIGMLREDYNRFIHSFNKKNERYKCYSIENNKEFLYPFGKILDTQTVLYEPDKNGNKLSVNIDVFVYDNAPDNNRLLKIMYAKRDLYWRLYDIKRGFFTLNHNNYIKNFIFQVIQYILHIVPNTYFIKKVNKNSRRYEKTKTKRVGNFVSDTKIACSKSIFREFIDMEFEGHTYKAPVGYDEWLKAFYGNYMKLPPEEKRVSRHKFEAYIK